MDRGVRDGGPSARSLGLCLRVVVCGVSRGLEGTGLGKSCTPDGPVGPEAERLMP